MPYLEIPNMPCIFFMLGKSPSSIAAQAASSVRDHIPSQNLPQMQYVCAMDENDYNDLEQQIKRHEIAKCTEALYYNTLNPESAAGMIDHARQEIVRALSSSFNLGINTNGLTVYYVVQTAEINTAVLFGIENSVRKYAEMLGYTYRNALCLISSAKYTDYSKQGKWLSEIDASGQPHTKNGFNSFEKILLLTPRDSDGMDTVAIRRKLEDSFPVALFMAHNSNYVPLSTHVYTIGYDKLNATSADLRLLRDHIASEELENWFAKSSGKDPWSMIYTESLPTTAGDNPLYNALETSARNDIPSLADLVLTADLDKKEFNPIEHIVCFEELNGNNLRNQEDWKRRWIAQLLEKIRKSHQLDRLKDYLSDTVQSISLKRSAHNIIIGFGEASFTPSDLRDDLEAIVSPSKTLFENPGHYNLRCLNAYYSTYKVFCSRRAVYERAKCIESAVNEVCAMLEKWIQIRRNALSKHLIQDRTLIDNLTNLCGSYANLLRSAFRQLDVSNDLIGFVDFAPSLYNETNDSWEELYTTYRNQVTPENDFTAAFIKGKSETQLRDEMDQAFDANKRLLTGWPTAAGAPHPTDFYMMRHDLLLHLNSNSLIVREIPGDLVERLSTYSILNRNCLDDLLTMGIFRTDGADVASVDPVNIRSFADVLDTTTEVSEDNPWNIELIFENNVYHIKWKYFDQSNSCKILINNTLISPSYTYADYSATGHAIKVDRSKLGESSHVNITIINGSLQKNRVVKVPRTKEEFSIKYDARAKRVALDAETGFSRAYVDYVPDYESKCILRAEKKRGIYFDYLLEGNGDSKITLWVGDHEPKIYLIH